MTRRRAIVLAATAILVVAAAAGVYQTMAQDKAGPAPSADEAAVRKTATDFVKAFNAGDAPAAAALWTRDAEYTGDDGETIKGRDNLQRSYTEFFKKNPKATIEVNIESVKMLGKYTAIEEGTLVVKSPRDKEPGVSRYSVLHVREDDAWRMASGREWVPSPAELVTVKDLEWMVGVWTAKGPDAEVRLTYAWDEAHVYLHGRYALSRNGKPASSGLQIIGKNPIGGLRAWVFDSTGTFGESVWMPDGKRWVIDADGTLPDGSAATATNVLVPLGPDAFTWQSIERTAGGTALPDSAPLRVTRVKGEK